MPVIRSASKKMRQALKRRGENRLKKEQLKRTLKKAQKVPTVENIRAAVSAADKAAKTNLISKNKADRLKSRLSKLLTQTAPQKETAKKTKQSIPRKRTKKATGKKPLARKKLSPTL